jgi:hypothetical protein
MLVDSKGGIKYTYSEIRLKLLNEMIHINVGIHTQGAPL